MLLAGIQAEFGLDPRLKHSGVTILRSRIFHLNRNRRGTTKDSDIHWFYFVLFVIFVVN